MHCGCGAVVTELRDMAPGRPCQSMSCDCGNVLPAERVTYIRDHICNCCVNLFVNTN